MKLKEIKKQVFQTLKVEDTFEVKEFFPESSLRSKADWYQIWEQINNGIIPERKLPKWKQDYLLREQRRMQSEDEYLEAIQIDIDNNSDRTEDFR